MPFRSLVLSPRSISITSTSTSTSTTLPHFRLTPRTISGRVLDEADNGISGAVVELTDLQTGKKVATFSEEGGKYRFSDLERAHDYEVKASYKGAPSEVRKASSLGERQVILNLRIPPPQSSDK